MEAGKITTYDEWEILPPTRAVGHVTKPVVDEWEILPPEKSIQVSSTTDEREIIPLVQEPGMFTKYEQTKKSEQPADTKDEWEILPPKKSLLSRIGAGAAYTARQVGGVAEAAARTVGGLVGFPVSVATTLASKTLGGKTWQEAQESGEKVASVFGGGDVPLLPESQPYQEVMNAPFTMLGAGIKKGAEVMAPNEPETQAMLETAAGVMMLMTPYLKGEAKTRIKALREKNIPINLEEARRIVKETPAPKEIKAKAAAQLAEPLKKTPAEAPGMPVVRQTVTPPPLTMGETGTQVRIVPAEQMAIPGVTPPKVRPEPFAPKKPYAPDLKAGESVAQGVLPMPDAAPLFAGKAGGPVPTRTRQALYKSAIQKLSKRKRIVPIRPELGEMGFEEKMAAGRDAAALRAHEGIAAPPKERRQLTRAEEFYEWLDQRGEPVGIVPPEAQPLPKGTWTNLYQKTVNRMQAIESITAKARKRGAPVLPGENPKLRARESLSSSIKADEALNYQTFRISPEGARVPTGEGLTPILADFGTSLGIKDVELGRRVFNDYFQSVRYLEDIGGRASAEQLTTAQNKLSALRKKYGGMTAFEDVAKRVYAWENRVYHNWVEAGLLKQEAYDKIVRENPHHVPFERVLDEIEGPSPASPREARFSDMRAQIHELRGSERGVKDVLDTFVKRTSTIYSIAEKNSVARFVAKLADYVPEDIQLLEAPKKPIKLLPAEQVPGGPSVIYRPTYPKGKNIIDYVENGEIKYMRLKDTNLYNAMSGLNEKSFGMAVKLLSVPTQWLKVGATSTPEFMVKNAVFRDPATGFIQSNVRFIPYWDTVMGLADILKKTDLFHEWRATGGAGSAFVGIAPGNLKKMIQGLPAKKGILSKMNILGHAQRLSLLLENSNRMGIYRAAKRHGLTAVEAAFESREGTLDFFRRGSHTADVNQLVAFFNAGVQSVDKFVRVHMENPKATVAKATAAITVPSVLLYLVNRNDPTYKDLPQWQKNLFWYVPIPGTERYFFIPKPFIFGMTYGSLPERFLEYLDTKDKSVLTELAKSMMDVTSPVSGDVAGALIPTALKALVENYANKDFFRGGQPIVSAGKEGLLPQEQSAARTSETAKAIGKTLGVSPAKIEHQVLGLTGGTGRYALQATDFVLQTLGGPATTRPKNPPDITGVPGIGTFISRPSYATSSHSLDKFYKTKEAVGQQYATFQKYVRDGRGDEAQKLAQKYPALPFASDLNKIANDFSDTRRAMDLVRQSSKSGDEKKALLLKLQEEMIRSAQKYNQFIESVKKRSGDDLLKKYGVKK